ncbi:MAG: YjjG family noncanonical pyrimidine nucleotidase [Eubacteriales bacterium]|nr:YjjG family noncanonical pyrimidine nucleotidase [Eubacteriales bacterium]
MIKNILLDLDNTLLDFDKAERIALSYTLNALGVEPSEEILERYHEINIRQWQLLELGEINRDQVKLLRFQYLFEELGCPEKAKEAAILYEERLGLGHHFIEGAEALLDTLSDTYRLYLVTNGTTSVQRGRIKSSGIKKYFKGIFISELIGYDKPDARYFEACFSKISDFRYEESILIGDSLSSDIQGGVNVGIKTIWMNRKKEENKTELHPDFEVSHLDEIPAILEEL